MRGEGSVQLPVGASQVSGGPVERRETRDANEFSS